MQEQTKGTHQTPARQLQQPLSPGESCAPGTVVVFAQAVLVEPPLT